MASTEGDIRQYVISVKVENRFGVLARVASLFSARGYNIDSLTVSATEQEDVSIMTIVVQGDDRVIEQVKKQLNKLINVIKVTDHTDLPTVEREFVLVKVNATSSKRAEIYQLGEIFKADIADISPKTITLGVKGDPENINNFIELLKPYGIKELMRTGRVSLLKE
ncbi:MAG: acetolactate synthase small subunit [Spirochaetes bacterium RBG_13_51_14]|nr:MAG: acetolactate synthase small subunit [Spirochaetes bacterium RBG_13_51_14]